MNASLNAPSGAGCLLTLMSLFEDRSEAVLTHLLVLGAF